MNRKNKSVIFAAVLVAFMLILSPAAFADSSADHGESIDAILSGIRSDLKLGAQDTIDPAKVSDASLEKLGEAVMSFRIPDPRQHEFMDKMMGGEGSESLANMHKFLGYRYLENGSTDFGSMMGGISSYRGENMFGRGFGGTAMEGRFGDGSYGGWMPGYMLQGYGWVFPLLIVVLIIAAAILIVLFVKRNKKADTLGNDSLRTLKERYVKGEIDRETYMKMKDDLLGV